ncbi:MAG TPA: alanine racemase [Candidatus Saccharimonadales bacterium]|nr:alanine racemase [Candidatus Saccharimonadales bacterium]
MSAPSDQRLRWVEIDVDTLAGNAHVIATLVRPARVMAMVKSNGYGHGMEIAARAALDGGATWLGVYTPGEALALREAGVTVRTLVLGWTPPSWMAQLIAGDVDVTILDADGVRAAAAAADATGHRVRGHVKLDTGLHRLGTLPETVESLVAALRTAGDRIEVAGLFTHFADAGADSGFTVTQHARFLAAVELIKPVAPGALLHTSGSAAVLAHPAMHHDLVRVGIAFYGYPPVPGPASIRPAMHVFCRIAQVRTVAAGETVGYGRTWRAETPRRIATATMGYGQGLPRALSNSGHLAIGGRRCRIVGVVSMDQVSVDVTDIDGVATGDVAMFIGERDGVRIGADEVADLTGTLPHEILCGVSEGIPRLPGAAPAALP